MPALELFPISTAVVVAGWNNPTNAYSVNNTYATSTTDNAEQSYDYNAALSGVEIIDKVFVKVKWYNILQAVLSGDNATLTFSVKVYDGSTWTTYQVTKLVYSCTTVNGESFTSTDGDNNNNMVAIDCTSILNTLQKLNAAQTAILIDFTKDAGLTLTVGVDCVSLLVCYHDEGGAWATTTRDLKKKPYKALETVEKYLTVTS